METPLGLYLHIPFCRSKCAYCDFYSLGGREDRMDAYTAALCRHLETAAPSAAGYVVDTVYFGGGTPSYLGAERLLRLWDAVRRGYALSDDAEVTLEANPDSAGAWLGELRRAGFNRVSLGMQSADDGELAAVGRVHRMAQVERAVDAVRGAGFGNLSLDLIYGLPGQTPETWRKSVRAAAGLGPEHLSCYGLKLEPGTPLYAARDRAALPDDEEQAAAYLWAAERLAGAGYVQYEVSNFARPGMESRHNLKYWTLSPYLGFGPGAHSDFNGRRFAYARDLEGYLAAFPDGDALPEGGPPLSEDTAVTDVEREREWLMLGLRTAAGLDASAYEARFGHEFGRFLPFLERCRGAGYACREGTRWRLTPRGFLVSNAVIVELLDLLDGGA